MIPRLLFRFAWALPLLLVVLSHADEPKPASPRPRAPESPQKVRTLGILVYEKFELLDVFGPAEVFGSVGESLKVVMVAEEAGPVASTQGPRVVADHGFDNCPALDLLLVPGGVGTLKQLGNERLIDWLKTKARAAEIVMSVCSGSAILAKAGLLDGRRATCNKHYFRTLTDDHKNVQWVVKARWVEDDKWVTSSGVSAGIDMSLAVVKRLYGNPVAEAIANGTEYEWHRDSSWDPFAKFVK